MFNGKIKYLKNAQSWEDNTFKSHQDGSNLKTTRLNQVTCSPLLSFELPKQHKLAFLSSDCLRRLWIAPSGIQYSSCCFHKFSWSKSQVIIHLNSLQVEGLNSIDADCATELYRDTARLKGCNYFICFSPNNLFSCTSHTNPDHTQRTNPMSNADTLNFIHSSYSSLMNTHCIQVRFLYINVSRVEFSALHSLLICLLCTTFIVICKLIIQNRKKLSNNFSK